MYASYRVVSIVFVLALAISGCASQKKEAQAWKRYDYRPVPSQQEQDPRTQRLPADDFGACQANDLVNFSCD